MSNSIVNLARLATPRFVEATEHLYRAGYGPAKALARDESRREVAVDAYLGYHGDAIDSLGLDRENPEDLLSYMRLPRCGLPDRFDPRRLDPRRLARLKHPERVIDNLCSRGCSTRHSTASMARQTAVRWPHYKQGIRFWYRFTQIGRRPDHRFSGSVDDAVRRGLNYWERISGIRFEVVGEQSRANISALDGTDSNPYTLAWSLMLVPGTTENTHPRHPSTGSTQLYMFNKTWNDDQRGNISLELVVAHEVGHILNLMFGRDPHSPNRQDVMFSSYIPGRADQLPGDNETSVVQRLYPGDPKSPGDGGGDGGVDWVEEWT